MNGVSESGTHAHEGGSVVIKEVPVIKARGAANFLLNSLLCGGGERSPFFLSLSRRPQEIIKEIRVEVPKVVHVPVEVIKEVPVEVVKYCDREVRASRFFICGAAPLSHRPPTRFAR